MNKIMIIGNVGSDPEMRYTPNGAAVTSFSVATNYRYTTADGQQNDETQWFRVSAWNKQAETLNQYVVKGMKIFIEGRVSSNAWTDKEGQGTKSGMRQRWRVDKEGQKTKRDSRIKLIK